MAASCATEGNPVTDSPECPHVEWKSPAPPACGRDRFRVRPGGVPGLVPAFFFAVAGLRYLDRRSRPGPESSATSGSTTIDAVGNIAGCFDSDQGLRALAWSADETPGLGGRLPVLARPTRPRTASRPAPVTKKVKSTQPRRYLLDAYVTSTGSSAEDLGAQRPGLLGVQGGSSRHLRGGAAG